MTPEQMNTIVIRFCQGESVTDISAYFALRRSSVEDLLRQAMFQLMKVRETSESPLVLTDAH